MSGLRHPALLRALLRMALGAMLMLLPAALAGCVGFHPPRADVADPHRIVYIDRAVPVACLDAKALPVAPAPVGAQLSGEARQNLGEAGADAPAYTARSRAARISPSAVLKASGLSYIAQCPASAITRKSMFG